MKKWFLLLGIGFMGYCKVSPPPEYLFVLDLATPTQQNTTTNSDTVDSDSNTDGETTPNDGTGSCNLGITRLGFLSTPNSVHKDYLAGDLSLTATHATIAIPYGIVGRGILSYDLEDSSLRVTVSGVVQSSGVTINDFSSSLTYRLESTSLTSCFRELTVQVEPITPVVDTGATICWDYNTTAPAPFPDCTHATAWGQDGVWGNIPNSRSWDSKFQVSASSGITRDRLTGLIWRVCPKGLSSSADCGSGSLEQHDFTSANAYCTETLNSGDGYAGLKGWRLPTVQELSSLINRSLGDTNGLLDSNSFPNSPGDIASTNGYWTSNVNQNVGSQVWRVHFQNDVADGTYHQIQAWADTMARKVRCVAGVSPPEKSFRDLGSGRVLDEKTNLVWQKCIPGQTETSGDCNPGFDTGTGLMDWQTALEYCSTKIGETGFRLPNTNEILSLYDYGKTTPGLDGIFSNPPTSDSYWTSTTNHSSPTYAFYMGTNGILDSGIKTGTRMVRCVRDN